MWAAAPWWTSCRAVRSAPVRTRRGGAAQRRADARAAMPRPPTSAYFVFATGIENSYPTIDGGRRVDQMEASHHYDRWKEDFALVAELGVYFLRYGPPLHR